MGFTEDKIDQEAMEIDHQIAPAAIDDNLNLFSLPAENVGVLDRRWVITGPVNTSIDANSVIEFNVDGNAEKYIDLKNTRLLINFKMFNADGKPLKETDMAAPINLFLATMWRQVEIQLNHENLRGVNTNYPYKAIFDALLETTSGYKIGQLGSSMFAKDLGGMMDAHNKAGGNTGFDFRRNLTTESEECEMTGGFYLDICQQKENRLILNGVHLNIKMWPASNEFKFMADNACIIKLTRCALKLCLVTVNPEIMVAQREVMQIAPVVYPFYRSDIKTFSVAATEMNLTSENLFNSRVPHKVIVGIVTSKAYNGDFHLNPFNFKHFNVKQMTLTVDGNAVPSEGGFKPNFKSDKGNLFMEEYLALNGDNIGNPLWYHGIELKDFAKGYAIYVFSVRTEHDIKKRGLTRLNIEFAEALPEAVTVIVYGKFPDMYQIDQYNKVIQT